jgi:anionic cell wall polymer biosynthesis LytR-Cps2A-Psr (LCP) family protein
MKTKMLTAVAVLAAALLTGIFSTTSMAAYASSDGDESETNTEQEIKQKNVGSGESTNFNCAQNLINSQTEQECEAEEEIDDGGLERLLDGLLR